MLYYALEIREYHNDSMFSKLFLASDMKVGEKKIKVVNRYKTAVSDLFYCYLSELICDLSFN